MKIITACAKIIKVFSIRIIIICAKNVVPLFGFPLYIFLFLFEKVKLVISNHFDRLKTQSEKYMALKDKI